MKTQPLRLLIPNQSRQREKRGSLRFRWWQKVKRSHHHIVVDSQGLLIGVLVTEANASERLGAVEADIGKMSPSVIFFETFT